MPRITLSIDDVCHDSGLSREQVVGEMRAGRLSFEVDATGEPFTDRFSMLEWIQRRLQALARFGAPNVTFPVFPCDQACIDDLPEVVRARA